MAQDHSVAGPAISYASAETNQSSERLTLERAAIIAAAAAAVAICAALVLFVWTVLRIRIHIWPVFLVQAAGIGVAMAEIFVRQRVRSRLLLWTATVVVCFASLLMFLYGAYQHQARSFVPALIKSLMSRPDASSAQNQGVINLLRNSKSVGYDRFVIFPATGHHGFVGYLMLKANPSWIVILAVELVLALSLTRASRGFATRFVHCHDCGRRLHPVNALVLPTEYAKQLHEAVLKEDAFTLMAMHHLGDLPLGSTCVIARRYKCERCQLHFADAVLKGKVNAFIFPFARVNTDVAAALAGKYEPPMASFSEEAPAAEAPVPLPESALNTSASTDD